MLIQYDSGFGLSLMKWTNYKKLLQISTKWYDK